MRHNWICRALAVLALTGMMMPMQAGAETPVPAKTAVPQIRDVAMSEGNVLLGQAFDPQGRPLVRAKVVAIRDGQEIAQTLTDAQGRYTLRALPSGRYSIQAGGANGMFRVWTAEAAPPSASPVAVVTADSAVVLGQSCEKKGLLGGMKGANFLHLGLATLPVMAGVVIGSEDDSSLKSDFPPPFTPN